MHCHLVTVKVRVEGSTNQRVELNGLALYQNRLKRLDAKAVQGRSTVEHNRVFFNNLFQYIPHLWPLFFHHFLGAFYGGDQTTLFKLVVDKRLEQFERHFLGKTALVQL